MCFLGTDLLMNWFLFRSVVSSWLKKQEQGAGPLTLLLLLHCEHGDISLTSFSQSVKKCFEVGDTVVLKPLSISGLTTSICLCI